MKIHILTNFLIVLSSCQLFGVAQDPVLVVLLMVKDEQQVIIPTLESYLTKDLKAGKPDTGSVAYVLYDTGSTDSTLSIARQFFQDHNISQYTIEQEPFINFAASRNRALSIARQAYPRSTFILFPDAEWYMHEFDALVQFCHEKITQYESGVVPPPYYCLRMERPDCYVSLTPRLFLTHDTVEFEGVVHECPTKYSQEKIPPTIYIELGSSKCGADKSRNRWYRDRNLLLQDLQEHPDNSRSTLYLGLTEQWLGHNDIAYIYLKKRIKLPAFPEEDYYALFHLAEVTEYLSESDPENYSWEEALGYYMQAYKMRPHRVEPLVRLADYYIRREHYAVGYLFARRAAELPHPSVEREIMPIQLSDYDYSRWELLSRAAWYVGEFEIGEQATKKAIEARPNYPHLYSNLAFYWERHQNSPS